MTRPMIVITQADGTNVEREMTDEEFNDYEKRQVNLALRIEEIHAKIEDRANKLANP